MKGFHLTPEQLQELRLAHIKAKRRNASAAYKINAVILLGTGWTIARVKEALLLDDETLRNYVKRYQLGGVKLLVETNYKGSECRLSEQEIETLKYELETNIHLTTQSVIEFVQREFEEDYSQSGMRDLLHRLGYTYKKPKLVPGNPDTEAQEVFAEQYEAFMQEKPAGTEVLFLDAVHPEHNTMAAYGWLKRGEKREIKTNSGRERLNLHGAINAESMQVTVIESETVNTDSTLELFQTIEQAYPLSKEIVIILDNARYHYSKPVQEYIENSKIRLAFLPSYSPNLNLIERLWKFFKKKVLYNRYHENLKAFRQACIDFFRNISHHHDELRSIMSAEFELA